ncbi:MAG: hypothetical protein JOZ52_09605 [Acidobacteria bacterium]|nr:hypothetical protein [Acidobacteriota bacterium]
MKYQSYFIVCLLTAMLTWFASATLGLPFWAIMLLALPALGIAQMNLSNRYNGRASLEFEPVPETGYQARLDGLEMMRHYLFPLGFQKTDEFYLKTSCDVVTFLHQHESEPVYLCNYHFGKMVGTDLITHFENDITLTTCTLRSAGTAPRPPRNLLQVFENRPLEEVFDYHQHAIAFIKHQGLMPVRVSQLFFKARFMQSLREFYSQTRNVFWPVKFMYWHFTHRGKLYAKPIQEQYLAGMIKIFPKA